MHRLEENIQSFESMRRDIQINNEKIEAINIQQQVNVTPTEAQQTSDKLNRANESDETTKINEK